MSIREVDADIFDVEADTYVITINLVGAMGAGVARRARDSVPGLMAHYRKMYRTIRPDQFIVYNYDGKLFLLVPTKIDWRDDSPEDLVVSNLKKLAALSAQYPQKFGTIAMPPMGCGNGNLDWESKIGPITYNLFMDHPCEVIVVNWKRRSQ